MSKKNFSRRQVLKAGGLLASSLAVGNVVRAADKNDVSSFSKDDVVFITGAARGIGMATAEIFAKEGVNVVIFDIVAQVEGVKYSLSSPHDLEQAKAKVEGYGVQCIAIKGDVRSTAQLNEAVSKCMDRFGRIDYLVANAAVVNMGPLDTLDDEVMQSMLDVNIGGVAKTIRAVVPVMKKQKRGRIVTLASTAGRGGSPYFTLYSATKFGVIGLTKGLAIELGSFNITCNAICPTGIRTKMLLNDHILNLWSHQNPTEEGMDELIRGFHTLPVGMLDPEDIAAMVKFLCSKEGAYLSGAILDVNAGWTAKNMA